MTPRWESPFDPSPRDAALLAEVLGALQSHLTDGAEAPAGEALEEGGPSSEVRELISAAIAELHRVSPAHDRSAGIAPVLGSGVVHELLRRKREARPLLLDEPEPTVDERL
ncbi:MAG: hypothetical protein IPF98_05820 [Gemmatimonadetes bacterium]|nr:hypothetical protein [Gemmatimonadota bacterium]